MKSVNTIVKDAIRKNHVLHAQPKLTAEWNMNRYYDTFCDNSPSEDLTGFDIELFPIESITLPFRPTKGILKARVDEAIVTDLTSPVNSRYYTVSDIDVYHYWTSPMPTDNAKTFTYGGWTDGFVHPYVSYEQDVLVNKIVVKVENFWATPDLFYIKTKQGSPGTWTTVSTSPNITAKGEIILYWNGSTWSSTKPSNLTNPPLVAISGIQVDVRTMKEGLDLNGNPSLQKIVNTGGNSVFTNHTPDGKNSFFNLIEISARREVDLSSHLISVSDEFDASEVSELYPVGTITSNIGSITLSNIYFDDQIFKPGLFNNDNPDSPFYGVVQPNVKFNLEYVYDIGGVKYSIQQFVMYGEDWMNQTDEEVTVELSDASKFLKDMTPPPALYEGLNSPKIFQRLLDSVGFTDWHLDAADRNEQSTIPIFWTTGENNVWEELDELAKGTQSAIYFDAFGVLQIKTRNSAYDNTKPVDWTITSENIGSDLPDLISLEDNGEIGTNHFTISYQGTAWDEWNNGAPNMQKIWQPEDTVTLASSPLIRSMNEGDTVFWVPPSQVVYWPYSGHVQIDGEIIAYRGKHMVYWTGPTGATFNQTFVGNEDEYRAVNELTPAAYRSKNYLTGAIAVAVDDDGNRLRGDWNTEEIDHKVDTASYQVRNVFNGTSSTLIAIDAPGMTHVKNESYVALRQPKNADAVMALIGSPADSGWRYAGTKLRFVSWGGITDQQGGIVINASGAAQSGYYIDLRAFPVPGAHNGLAVYSFAGNKFYPLANIAYAVAQNVWYEIDVALYDAGGGNQILKVFINGRIVVSVNIPSSAPYYQATGGRFGFFQRGKSATDFEYLYGIARDEPGPLDDASFFNMIYGGYTGQMWQREWVHGWYTKKKKKKKKSTKETAKWNNYFFDEFGPYVHEIREFDIKFDPMPVKSSRLYSTNNWYSVCTQYLSSPFGAKFTMVNTSRSNAILNGDDNSIFTGQTVNQVLAAIGRVLVFQEVETVIAKDEDSIRKRGKLETELSSKWIQTKAMAEEVSNWMKSHWATGLDTLSVSVFGNPLFEIGDVVNINYPEKFMTTSTHSYYVTGIKTSFDAGIGTELTLRRVKV